MGNLLSARFSLSLALCLSVDHYHERNKSTLQKAVVLRKGPGYLPREPVLPYRPGHQPKYKLKGSKIVHGVVI